MQRKPKRVGPYCRSQFSTLFFFLCGPHSFNWHLRVPKISVWNHNITYIYNLRLYVIKTTKNEIIGSPTLADELAKSLDLRLPQHEMQYHRCPKSPNFEILQTQTHITKFYKIWYSTNTASLNMPEIIGLQTI